MTHWFSYFRTAGGDVFRLQIELLGDSMFYFSEAFNQSFEKEFLGICLNFHLNMYTRHADA